MKTKTNNVREGVPVTFGTGDDEFTVEIYPVSLRQLRKLNKAVQEMSTDNTNFSDEDIDAMISAMKIIFEKVRPELAEDEDAIEDIVDIYTFNIAVAAAMGADPKALMEM